jgi:AsmA family protein
MQRRQKVWLWLGILVGVPVLIGLLFDSNRLKGPVERAVTERVGRPFTIHGDFDIVPRLRPRIVMEGVQLANPEWAAEPDMLRLERAEITIALLPLLRGAIVLPEVTLANPVIDLERNAAGENNWTLPQKEPRDEGSGTAPVIGLLTVDRGLVQFRDATNDTAVTVNVETTQTAAGRGLGVKATGQYLGRELEGSATGGPILSLADTTTPYPLDVTFRVGGTGGAIKGTVTGLATLAAADLQLDVRGDTASDLYDLIRLAIPPTPPYHVSGRLIRETGWWRFHGFKGTVGDSDLSGDADFAMGEGRSRLQAKLQSSLLDLDDLGGFVGADPETGPGETASAQQQRRVEAKAAKPRVLPDLPIKLDRLRAMDADVEFVGKAIRGKTPVDDMKTRIVVEDGVLRAAPLDFGVAGGNVVARLTLDGRKDVAGIDGDFEFRRVDLSKLFPGNAMVANATGLVGGRAALKGSGNSLAEFLADADGTLGLASSGGKVSNLVLELAGLDVAEALRLLFRGDKAVRVRCAVADVGVQDGVIETRNVIVDTTDTNIKVDGKIDLGSEKLDLTLHPLPKDYSPLALRSPIHLNGTFKKPAIRPDSELLVRGGVAAVLAAVAAPVTALVALIESGPGDNVDCERLIDAVQRNAQEPVRKD